MMYRMASRLQGKSAGAGRNRLLTRAARIRAATVRERQRPDETRCPSVYNRNVTRQLLPVLLALSLLGCGKGIQNEAAVRQGVIDYLSQRSDLNITSMQVDVTSVSFRQNEADATVTFRPKGATTGAMQMRYTLERQGSRWVVKGRGRAQAGQSPHGAGQQMPPGAASEPPSGAAAPGDKALPPGHPPIGSRPGK